MKVYVNINDFNDLLRGSDDPVYLRATDIGLEGREIILEMSYSRYLELVNDESPGCFQVDYAEQGGKYLVNFINRVWEGTTS